MRGVARVVELLVVLLVLLPPGEEEPLRRHGDALARVDRLLHLPHRREVPHLEGELPAPRRRERHVHSVDRAPSFPGCHYPSPSRRIDRSVYIAVVPCWSPRRGSARRRRGRSLTWWRGELCLCRRAFTSRACGSCGRSEASAAKIQRGGVCGTVTVAPRAAGVHCGI